MPHPRPARRFSAFLLTVVVFAVAVPIGAVAAGRTQRFSDVSSGHPFEAEITWLTDTGITSGYPDGTYRPGQSVQRGSMAAFLARLYDVQEDEAWATGSTPFDGFSPDAWTDVPGATAQVSVPPGVTGRLEATFSAQTTCTKGVGSSWCTARMVVSEDGGPFTEMLPAVGTDFVFARDTSGGATDGSHAFTRIADGASGSTYTVKVQGQRWSYAGFTIDDWVLAVETELLPLG